jgi:hypothetical protein
MKSSQHLQIKLHPCTCTNTHMCTYTFSPQSVKCFNTNINFTPRRPELLLSPYNWLRKYLLTDPFSLLLILVPFSTNNPVDHWSRQASPRQHCILSVASAVALCSQNIQSTKSQDCQTDGADVDSIALSQGLAETEDSDLITSGTWLALITFSCEGPHMLPYLLWTHKKHTCTNDRSTLQILEAQMSPILLVPVNTQMIRVRSIIPVNDTFCNAIFKCWLIGKNFNTGARFPDISVLACAEDVSGNKIGPTCRSLHDQGKAGATHIIFSCTSL